MAKAIEETLKDCKCCNRKTIHLRNTNKTSGLMMLVHVALTIVTWGVWLVLVIIWAVLNKPIGGWMCKECGK